MREKILATAPITALKNLGTKSERMLGAVGVCTVGDLRRMGAIEAYWRVKLTQQGVSVVLLWAIVAGLRGQHWTAVTAEEKIQLKKRLELLEE